MPKKGRDFHKLLPLLFFYCLFYVCNTDRRQDLLTIYHSPPSTSTRAGLPGIIDPINASSPPPIRIQRIKNYPLPPFRMLLGIWSMDSPEEAQRRILIRNTYLSLDKRLQEVNVTNLARTRTRICSLVDLQVGNLAGPEDCQLVYTFVVGAANKDDLEAPTERVDGEMTVDRSSQPDYERDVTYLNIRENLKTGKTATWFGYGSSSMIADSLQIDLIAKVDSDTVVYPTRFIDLLEREQLSRNNNTSDPARGIYGGHLRPGSGYYKGGLYFMSKDVARNITSADCDRSKLKQEDLKKWDHPAEDRLTGYFVQKCAGSSHQMSLMKGVGWDHLPSLKKSKDFRVAWEVFLDKQIAKEKFQEVVQKYYPNNDCLPDEVFSVALGQISDNSTRIRKRFSKLVKQSKAHCAEGITQ
jgi:hypothetical protein